jgi:NAD(P)-dependent dehydrogenase (short-subunit alcohol dehydrogenase family)
VTASGLRAFRVDGQVALITGGAQGIGLACAELFSEAGASVVLLDRDEAALEAARERVPQAHMHALDVADEAAVERTFDVVAGTHGRIDILVNNAGRSIRKPSFELPRADWDAVVAVNLTGAFLCARAAARHMSPARPPEGAHSLSEGQARSAKGAPVTGGGSIVNTASMMGLSGGGLYPNVSYHATKGGLVTMTRALAVEWAPRGIRVNAVAPTWTRTQFIGPLTQNAELMQRIRSVTPLQRLAEPHEVALAILFLASPAAAMVTGHVLAVDGGFLAQ